ncbi:hypothetical protein LT493_36210 [Streptomyces tricolor]|nr:hypothetical protein [Streptomyces tricolor]
MELGWIRHEVVPETDDAYFTMSTKKTGWYTCISPCRIGAVCAGVTDPGRTGPVRRGVPPDRHRLPDPGRHPEPGRRGGPPARSPSATCSKASAP